jgi:hypothetical protein
LRKARPKATPALPLKEIELFSKGVPRTLLEHIAIGMPWLDFVSGPASGKAPRRPSTGVAHIKLTVFVSPAFAAEMAIPFMMPSIVAFMSSYPSSGMWTWQTSFTGQPGPFLLGMGVVSGIVMAFQFGTNWSVLAERTGSIQGPLLGYEAFTAFLLEATFFGVVLLGRDRAPPWFYFFSCCMVSIGTMFSSFWILSNNSWMQVPLGHAVVDGRLVPDSLVGHHLWTHHARALAAHCGLAGHGLAP